MLIVVRQYRKGEMSQYLKYIKGSNIHLSFSNYPSSDERGRKKNLDFLGDMFPIRKWSQPPPPKKKKKKKKKFFYYKIFMKKEIENDFFCPLSGLRIMRKISVISFFGITHERTALLRHVKA